MVLIMAKATAMYDQSSRLASFLQVCAASWTARTFHHWLKEVGRIYHFAKLYDRKTPLTAAAIM
jgi:hypothetical protein